jgi:hypothetical protein
VPRKAPRPARTRALPEPPRQITFQPPVMPADLSERDWSLIGEVVALVRATIPSDSDSPPAEVFGIIRQALLDHFDQPQESRT